MVWIWTCQPNYLTQVIRRHVGSKILTPCDIFLYLPCRNHLQTLSIKSPKHKGFTYIQVCQQFNQTPMVHMFIWFLKLLFPIINKLIIVENTYRKNSINGLVWCCITKKMGLCKFVVAIVCNQMFNRNLPKIETNEASQFDFLFLKFLATWCLFWLLF